MNNLKIIAYLIRRFHRIQRLLAVDTPAPIQSILLPVCCYSTSLVCVKGQKRLNGSPVAMFDTNRFDLVEEFPLLKPISTSLSKVLFEDVTTVVTAGFFCTMHH